MLGCPQVELTDKDPPKTTPVYPLPKMVGDASKRLAQALGPIVTNLP